MTASAITHSHAAAFTAPSAARSTKAASARPAFSASEFFALLQQSFAMARAIPDVGRVSAKDVEKIRAMFDAT